MKKAKSIALLGFLTASTLTILAIWGQSLSGAQEHEPRHIRRTLAAGQIQGFELTLTADPQRGAGDEHGAGQGSGQGSGQGAGQDLESHAGTPTPTPQSTPTLDLTNYPGQDVSDDLKDE